MRIERRIERRTDGRFVLFGDVSGGLEEIERRIVYAPRDGKKALILCAGGSASGKTSHVAEAIRALFPGKATILSLDSYFKGIEFMQQQWARGVDINYDQPEAQDLAQARGDILAFLSGIPIVRYAYDFKTGIRSITGDLPPTDILIVEGLFALDCMFMNIDECLAKIFVDIGTHGRFIRRLLRDIERTSWSASEIIGYFAKVTEPMHQQYVEVLKTNADIIVDNEYDAQSECRSGKVCQHLKFRGTLEDHALWRLGAERLGSFYQEDVYLNPYGKRLSETDEMVRIRSEGRCYTFSYMGPHEQDGFKKRRKVGPFEISEETAMNFHRVYGEICRTVGKRRTLYLLESGVIVGVDPEVVVRTSQGTFSLGAFTELRFIGSMSDEAIRLTTLELGLDINDAITDSYADMNNG